MVKNKVDTSEILSIYITGSYNQLKKNQKHYLCTRNTLINVSVIM